jgi:hypothetical protein
MYGDRLNSNVPGSTISNVRCVQAFAADAYRRFMGNASDWREYSNQTYFESAAGDDTRVYAWALPPQATETCLTTKPFICEIPLSVYPCFPPPLPPPSPPSPPSPPAPPAPPSCECCRQASVWSCSPAPV